MTRATHAPQGRHLLCELGGIAADLLRDASRIGSILIEAAQSAGATVIGSHLHSFGPQAGVTGVVLLCESHITIHTWPDEGYAALDIFMCGEARPHAALDAIATSLRASVRDVREFRRSAPDTSTSTSWI